MPHVPFDDFVCSSTPLNQPWSLARYRNPATLGFTPDGRSLYRISNAAGQQDLWLDERRLTDLGDRVARWFVVEPAGSVILAADRWGDEDHQLYRVTPDGRISDLIVRDGVQHHLRARSLSRDGGFLAYSANHRDRANVEVVARDLRSGEERTVLGGDAWHVAGDWSPDGRRVLASRVQDNTDQDLFVVDVRTCEAVHLTPHQDDQKNLPVGFDATGTSIYFLTDRGSEFLWLAKMDLRTREVTTVARGGAWDILVARLDRDANTVVWLVNEDGCSRLQGMDLRSGEPLPLPSLEPGWVNDFIVSADGRRIAAQWSSAAAPWSIRVHDRGSGAGWRDMHPTTIAFSGPLLRDEIIRIVAPRAEIPAMLLRPRATGRIPLVLQIHGGPEDQDHRMYLAFRQYLVAHGVAVLVPNIHGSTGYGSSYQRAIHRDWGGIDLEDLEALARWALRQDWVDPERVAVYGGSYGGFAALSAATRLPRYWRVAAEAFGPSDLVTMIEGDASSWRRFTRRWIGDPERDADKLHARSPLTYAENLRCPLLVLQGANDPRVPKGESDQMVKRLRELGKDVTYIEQDHTGHGWTTRAAHRDAYGRIADFLLQRLR